MIDTRTPSYRLITQNLLTSAISLESGNQISVSSLQDLSVLIDLFCLYDQAVVISSNSWTPFLGLGSRTIRLLDDHSFVGILEPGPTDIEEIAAAAQKHLAACLGIADVERYDELIGRALSPKETSRGINHEPFTYEIISEMQRVHKWLYDMPRKDLLDELEGAAYFDLGPTFLIRTLIYLGCADVAKLTFTPDAVRCTVLENILKDEDAFLQQSLASELEPVWEQLSINGNRELQRTVSPFASIVFERARDRSEIAFRMEQLREDLTPLRTRINELEQIALWSGRDEADEAEGEWRQALSEIETAYGTEPNLVSIKRAIAFGEPPAEITGQPAGWQKWLSSLASLPPEITAQLVSQRPAVEIHSLYSESQGGERFLQSAGRLFGRAL